MGLAQAKGSSSGDLYVMLNLPSCSFGVYAAIILYFYFCLSLFKVNILFWKHYKRLLLSYFYLFFTQFLPVHWKDENLKNSIFSNKSIQANMSFLIHFRQKEREKKNTDWKRKRHRDRERQRKLEKEKEKERARERDDSVWKCEAMQ